MPKSRRKAKSNTPAIEPTETASVLAKSSLHIRLEALEVEHQKLLKQIKRKQTELNNFVEQMRGLARRIYSQSQPIVVELMDTDKEIHQIFQQIFKKEKLTKKNRQKIQEIYDTLQMTGIISPEEENQEDNDINELFEEEPESNQSQNYSYSEVETEEINHPASKEEAAKIRQTFLRLAEIFHPDKVTDAETQLRHTEIMKQLNKAYREKDLALLLEIEKQHLSGQQINIDNEDGLKLRCEKIEEENTILKKQYEHLKTELKLVKNTPEGEMVSNYRKKQKEQIDTVAEMVEELEKSLRLVKEIRDFVRDFQDNKITMQEFLQGPKSILKMRQEAVEQIFEELFGDSFDMSVKF